MVAAKYWPSVRVIPELYVTKQVSRALFYGSQLACPGRVAHWRWGHETTPIGEIHPAGHAGWSSVGVPGWVPLDVTLDSNDLTRLTGFDAREAGGREQQQVFQTVRLRAENDNCDLAGR